MKAKFSKTICLVLALVMVLAVGGISVSAATDIVPLTEFNGTDVGSWSASSGPGTTGAVVVADPSGTEGNTVLKAPFSGDTAKRNGRIERKFTAVNTGIIEQEFDYYAEKVKKNVNVNLYGASSTFNLFRISSAATGTVTLSDLTSNSATVIDSTLSAEKWYSFKVIYDVSLRKCYVFYKEKSATSWKDLFAGTEHSDKYVENEDANFGAISGIQLLVPDSATTYNLYIDNYSAKTITSDELYSIIIKEVKLAPHDKSLTVEAGVTSTQILQSNVPASPGSGVTVYSFSLTIPEENLGSGAARMCIIGSDDRSKPIFNILPDGRIRLALGAQSETYKPYADLRSAGKGTVDFKVILYTDTGCYDVLYKESIDATYTSICTMAYECGWDEEKQYGKYYASAGTLNAPNGLQLNCWYGNATTANEEYTVNLSNITMVSYPDADDMLSDPALFGAYYNALKEEKVVDDTFSAATDAAALSLIDAENITGNANILFAATNMTNVAAVKNTEYANYASAAATVNAADEEVSALIDFGVYTEDSATAKKVRLLKSLQECTGSKAAGINTYFNADSTILNADAVTVGGAGILMIAAYNVDNELISITDFVDLTALTEGNVSLTIPSGATTLKAFVWDSMDTITPLHSCDVVELAVVEE